MLPLQQSAHAGCKGDYGMRGRYTIKDVITDVVYDIVGSVVFAAGLICFVEPANLAPGGMSGAAILINYIWGLPVGLMAFLLNIPLLFMSWFFLGKRMTIKTVKSLAINSAVIDLVVARYFPVYLGDRMIGAVFGGVFMGAGLGIIFLRGSNTGGTDIISFLVKKWFPHLPIGKIMMGVDCVIIALSIYVFGNMEAGLYGVASLFCCSKVIDSIVYGMDKGIMVTVISDQNQAIAAHIMDEVQRGVTFLKGKGAYTGIDRDVLICAVRRQEFARVKAIIYEYDHDAFIITSETSEVMGEGFKPVKD